MLQYDKSGNAHYSYYSRGNADRQIDADRSARQ